MFIAFDWQHVFDKTVEGAIIGGGVGLVVGLGVYIVKLFLPKKPPEDRSRIRSLEEDDSAEPPKR